MDDPASPSGTTSNTTPGNASGSTSRTTSETVDWAEARARLSSAARNDAPWYSDLAARLVEPHDALALDVGCGGGGMAVALAHALPTGAQVIALDTTPELLEEARSNLAAAGIGPDRASVVRCDLEGGLEALAAAVPRPADLIWAAGVVHHVADQQGAVDALARQLAPEGRLALAEGGLSARHLPWDVGVGDPGLEIRLAAAQNVWFGRMRAGLTNPVPMPYGWDEALRRAGLRGVSSGSVLTERPAPLRTEDRAHVLAGLAARVGRFSDTGLLATDDVAAWNQLLDPGGAAWLGNRDDLFVLEARTVYVGRR